LAKVTIPLVLNTPVDEVLFMDEIKEKFENFNVHVSDDLPEILGKLCRTLNYSIKNPVISSINSRKIWAFPAQTGIGKSIALQIYVSMLKNEASLIVVSTKAEAHNYAKYICKLSNNDDYAMAIFSGGDAKKYKFAGECLVDPQKYRCLIITHARMQELANSDEQKQDTFRLYNGENQKIKKRELVVIDEKISFANHESISIDEYTRMLNFVENALVYSKECSELGKTSDVTEQLHTIKEHLVTEASTLSDDKSAKLIDPVEPFLALKNNKLEEKIDLQLFENVVETRFDELSQELNSIMNSKEKRFEKDKSKTLTLVRRFRRILQKEHSDGEYCDLKNMVLFKTNQATTISKFKQFYSMFGACVVLDATATVNEFYETASQGRIPSFDIINVRKIRKYKNLTIHTAKGFLQSRSALCGSDKKIASNLEKYKPVIDSLKSDKQKLLVIGHKMFVSSLESEYIGDGSVAFTNWGNHVGKNDWNDCFKVLVIGWNYLPEIETVSDIYGASMPSGDESAISKVTRENIDKFSVGQMAEDIVQAVMRTRARVIADDDSDCLPAEVYLLYPDRTNEQAVIDKVVAEFPSATVKSWNPPFGIDLSSFTKPQKNAHSILEALDESKQQGKTEVSWKEIRESSGLDPSTFSKAVKEKYFVKQCETEGITTDKINGKKNKFVF
jgi:hypothetical protein